MYLKKQRTKGSEVIQVNNTGKNERLISKIISFHVSVLEVTMVILSQFLYSHSGLGGSFKLLTIIYI